MGVTDYFNIGISMYQANENVYRLSFI